MPAPDTFSSPLKPALDAINPGAWAIAEKLAANAPRYRVEVHKLACGARAIDCGVVAPGGFDAGVEFARACMGGLGEVEIVPWSLGDTPLAGCRVRTDHPLVACIASQYAGWKIQGGKFSAMGSGPARAAVAAEPLFEKYALRVEPKQTVLLVESSELPSDEVAEKVAGRCNVRPDSLILMAAATGSTVGSVQIAARVVETALHKMMELGFDLTRIRSAVGFCPVPPVIRDPLMAIGRTNDAVLYGGEVHLVVDVEDEMLSGLVPKIPSTASRDHGRLFYDLFRQYGDFYKIDPMLFSPASISLANLRTGRIFRAGATSPELLRKSFGLP